MQFNTKLSAALALAFVLGSGVTLAHAKEGKALTPQQQRMSDCSHNSKGMKGDERSAFMSSCLKGKATPATAAASSSSQQSKMTACNADAKTKQLKGADRKAFMSDCLKGTHAASS